uniref:Chromodomain-helicase-DNA-binding protein 7 n=1 Tax=Tetraselmis sp. GSL018 TaxID=582737 RepID=A0A061RW02_9CHLO|eukprot:CAMPEP_0177616970 /NCGR_PEP_ID=MMETSP0419_2-20121207/24554_1 /TAXON_ID=582737 /ORGANISM="Tetraselmis sp., Strain GSL018" /LENGTH=1470 /DNA_ID=CAMNT_0019115293 /DNA_START=311 /DNA_END=4723 /DNA_ORIENTATION=-
MSEPEDPSVDRGGQAGNNENNTTSGLTKGSVDVDNVMIPVATVSSQDAERSEDGIKAHSIQRRYKGDSDERSRRRKRPLDTDPAWISETLADEPRQPVRRSTRATKGTGIVWDGLGSSSEDEEDQRSPRAGNTAGLQVDSGQPNAPRSAEIADEGVVVTEGASAAGPAGYRLDEQPWQLLLGEIKQIFAVKSTPEGQLAFVSYKGLSHRRNNWVPTEIIFETRRALLQSFLQKRGVTGEFVDQNGHPNGVNPEWLQVERVIAEHTYQDTTDYLVKWRSLPYSECTWEPESELEDDQDKIEAFRRYGHPSRAVSMPSGKRRTALRDGNMPVFLNGRALRDYQETSLRWNINNWMQHRNCILGDEMGLGKTAQSIAVIEAQRQAGFMGPFLVVAPLTTLGHWKREIETWTPMSCVAYSGGQADREVIQRYEMHVPAAGGGRKMVLGARFDVLLTSYECLRADQKFLQGFYWETAIIDEAHRLKSTTALSRQAILGMNIGWLLLLTGTPIQNNLQELFSLMNLLDAERYPSLEDFSQRFGAGGEPTPEQIASLQEALKPILLRRMKEDVEALPEKEEVIIWVELTREQWMYYNALYRKDIGTLLAGTAGKNFPGLRNLAMELRKLCCHPYLCNGLEEHILHCEGKNGGQPRSELENLVAASGKMLLLDKLLPKLRAEGHKVLIFSQFCIMLNVLEDYLRLRGFPVERIDGSTASNQRQAAIDRFCKEGSDAFVFLLSTKAGGQGITLTAADVVIIYDSDWNPQNDLQAMARCHRIGQKNDVKIYRLVSRDTYEEAVFKASSRKYGLDEAVLGGMGAQATTVDPELDRKRIMGLLKDGAHGLSAPQKASDEAAFAAEDIDQILTRRTEKRQIGSRAGNSFSVATFASWDRDAPAAEAAAGGHEDWSSILPDAVQAHKERSQAAKEATLNAERGRRERKRINYAFHEAGQSSDDDGDAGAIGDGAGAGGSDSGYGSDASGDLQPRRRAADGGPKPWVNSELKLLIEGVVAVGEGRTEQVRFAGNLGHRPLEEVSAVEASVVGLIRSIAELPGASGGTQIALVEQAIRKSQPPRVVRAALGNKTTMKMLSKDAKRWKTMIEERKLLADYIAGPVEDIDAQEDDVVRPPKAPTLRPAAPIRPWWTRSHDAAILTGLLKNGYGPCIRRGTIARILRDPSLGFPDRVRPATEQELEPDAGLGGGGGVDAGADAGEETGGIPDELLDDRISRAVAAAGEAVRACSEPWGAPVEELGSDEWRKLLDKVLARAKLLVKALVTGKGKPLKPAAEPLAPTIAPKPVLPSYSGTFSDEQRRLLLDRMKGIQPREAPRAPLRLEGSNVNGWTVESYPSSPSEPAGPAEDEEDTDDMREDEAAGSPGRPIAWFSARFSQGDQENGDSSQQWRASGSNRPMASGLSDSRVAWSSGRPEKRPRPSPMVGNPVIARPIPRGVRTPSNGTIAKLFAKVCAGWTGLELPWDA